MKHTLIIFALLTATIQTFAQSPRIKLNQITKDSLSGSVLISSPTDSGMVYSRDLFISYGADTVLILNGDTLAATSAIISSVLSDGVTIVGDGTTGSELTADTSVLATVRALSDSLALVISSVTADGVTITGDGTAGSPLKVDTTTYIATKADLDAKQDQLNGTGFVKATGTTISYDNSTYLTTEVDGSVTNELQTISTSGAAGNITLSDGGGTLNLNVNDADASTTNEIQDISTTGAAGNISISSGSTLNLNVDDADASATNEIQTLSYNSSTNEITLSDGGGTEDLSNLDLVDSTRINATGDTAYYYQNGTLIGTGAIAGGGGGGGYWTQTGSDIYYNTGNVGIGTSSPSADLEVAGDMIVDNSTLFVDATNNSVGVGSQSLTENFKVDGDAVFGGNILYVDTTINRVTIGHKETDYSFYKLDIRDTAGLNFAVSSFGTATNGGSAMVLQTADDAAYTNGKFILLSQYHSSNTGSNILGRTRAGMALIDAYQVSSFVIRNRANSDMAFGTNNTERMTIKGNGDLKLFPETSGASSGNTISWNNSDSTIHFSTSSIRFKENIQDYDKGIQDLMKLKPVYFNYKTSPQLEAGFIAEDVDNSGFKEYTTYDANGLIYGLRVNAFKPLIVKAIQEQQAIIEQQAAEINKLKSQIQLILSEIEQIKNN